jgi:hypothetical protein
MLNDEIEKKTQLSKMTQKNNPSQPKLTYQIRNLSHETEITQ